MGMAMAMGMVMAMAMEEGVAVRSELRAQGSISAAAPEEPERPTVKLNPW